MPKNAYSLILSDEVIRAVDAQALRLRTNRSALVNQILAESLSLSTPEMRLRDILAEVERVLDETALHFTATAAGTMTLRSALRYKYNPVMNYTVELREQAGSIGILRASVRTQNAGLISALQGFFGVWAQLEAAHLPGAENTEPRVYDTRFERTLRRPGQALTSAQLAGAITDYVSLLDACLQTFFAHLDQPGPAHRETERVYLSGLQGLGPAAGL